MVIKASSFSFRASSLVSTLGCLGWDSGNPIHFSFGNSSLLGWVNRGRWKETRLEKEKGGCSFLFWLSVSDNLTTVAMAGGFSLLFPRSELQTTPLNPTSSFLQRDQLCWAAWAPFWEVWPGLQGRASSTGRPVPFFKDLNLTGHLQLLGSNNHNFFLSPNPRASPCSSCYPVMGLTFLFACLAP